MQGKALTENKEQWELEKGSLENIQTYEVNGRSFIVQPVFKEEKAHPLGAILVRIMQADLETMR